MGMEETPAAFVSEMVGLFREIWRVLRDDGTCWLNLGDSYNSQASWGRGAESSTLDGGKPRAWRDGSGRADGKIDTRGQRNRNGTCAPGLKPKDLIGIPWEVAFALRADGWWLRAAIIWAKPNGMPGSQDDRPTSSYETVFMLTKAPRYWSDFDAIKTPPRESTMIRTAQDIQSQAGSHRANGGAKTNDPIKAVGGVRDKQRGHGRKRAGFNARWDAMEKAEQQGSPAMIRDVWFISPASSSDPHFAQMPEELARRCILAGCPYGGTVLDPFGGAGTTGLAADKLGREAILIELNPKYAALTQRRLRAALTETTGNVDDTLGLEPTPLFG
jgi:DNA modification methylase